MSACGLMLSSQGGALLATLMVVSTTTLLYLSFFRKRISSSTNEDHLSDVNHDSSANSLQQSIRSCLCSSEGKRKEKKHRVKFAENVKVTKGNGEEYRRGKKRGLIGSQDKGIVQEKQNSTGTNKNKINGMPANRIALYNGILRDRVHRIQCSW